MCGIFGMISKKPKPFNKRAFCTMGARNDSRGGDSCGVFIDGLVEYGVDKRKLFINFFRDSLILNSVTECQIALGHCRKASVGNVSIETAQPVVLYNEKNEIDYVLIHNGTIYNYKELAKKYIPEIDIEGLTDSQVMARIFYHAGYDALDEYYGGAVFVIHDYRINKSFVFKGCSGKYVKSVNVEEERPLYYCWHNGRFIFSSILETIYAFYYEETVYSLPCNKLLVIRGDKLKTVQEYKRDKVCQSKQTVTYPALSAQTYYADGYGYGGYYGSSANMSCYKIKFDGENYCNQKDELMHGVYFVTAYGYCYPKRETGESWHTKVAFFMGKLLKHPDAFDLLDKKYKEYGEKMTKEMNMLLHMLDFNPYSDDGVQHYWFDGEQLMIPQNEWKWPMADWSCVFDQDGILVEYGKATYAGWPTDYKMYTYDRDKTVEMLKSLCAEE